MSRTRISRFVGIVALTVSCGGSGGKRVPEGNIIPEKANGGSVVPSDARRLHERLATATAPLIQSPFGTAAAVTGIVGNVRSSAALGALWEGGPAARNESRFNVASISKVLTAARIVSLAHSGAIDLDDAVSKHLPGVRLFDKHGADRAGAITIRQLVQHRSGLPHAPRDLEQKVANRWSSPELLRQLTDSWELALDGTPGQFQYSNIGYALLGAIIERARNCSFADCMASYLIELGLTHSTFWPATLGDDAARGRVVVEGTARFNEPGWYASRYALPFTGLWTTTHDLAAFGAMLVATSKNPESPLHEMTTSLGVFRNTRLDATSLEHDGSGPGFRAALVVIPSKNIVLAVVTNGGNETKEEAVVFSSVLDSTLKVLGSEGDAAR